MVASHFTLTACLWLATVTNTDDFLWRLVKGCIQLGLVPDMNNTVNMVPVDHVARCCAVAAVAPLPPPQSALSVLHVTAAPRPTQNKRRQVDGHARA